MIWSPLRPAGHRPSRALVATAAALLSATALSGCSVTNPATTKLEYDAGDGVSATMGKVVARNLVLVSPGKDAEGSLVGMLVNEGSEDATFQVSLTGGSGKEVTVPGHGTVRLEDNDGSPVALSGAPAAGGWAQVTFKGEGNAAYPVSVPVLPQDGIYKTIGGSATN